MRSLFLALIASGSLTGLCAAATDDIFAANKKLGREINLGNALEAPKEGEWGVTLNARNADLVEGLPDRQVRGLDGADDLELLGCRISQVMSSPSAITLFLSRRFSRVTSASAS